MMTLVVSFTAAFAMLGGRVTAPVAVANPPSPAGVSASSVDLRGTWSMAGARPRPAVGVTWGGVQPTSRLDSFGNAVGRFPQIVMWYQDFTGNPVQPAFMNAIRSRGGLPMVTWEPDNHLREREPQPAYALRRIVNGRFDPYLRRVAAEAAAYRHEFMIRFGEEMNGDWYPWGVGVDGNTPTDFVAAWRHVVRIFRAAGAHNVVWVWSPNILEGSATFKPFYPGESWVDWVGLDGYNDGRPWKSPLATFGASYDSLSRLTRKPLMIAETASTTISTAMSKANWIRRLFGWALPGEMPRVRAVVWFDMNRGRADWRLENSPAAFMAFSAAVRRGSAVG